MRTAAGAASVAPAASSSGRMRSHACVRTAERRRGGSVGRRRARRRPGGRRWTGAAAGDTPPSASSSAAAASDAAAAGRAAEAERAEAGDVYSIEDDIIVEVGGSAPPGVAALDFGEDDDVAIYPVNAVAAPAPAAPAPAPAAPPAGSGDEGSEGWASRAEPLSAGNIRIAIKRQLVVTASRVRESLMQEPALEDRGVGVLGDILDIGWSVKGGAAKGGRRRWLGLDRSAWFDVVSEQAAAHALLTALREEALMGEDRNVAGIEDVALVASRQLLVLAQGMQGALLAHDASKELITRFFNSVHAEQVSSLRLILRSVRRSLEALVGSKHVALLILALYCTSATFSASAVGNPYSRVRERQWALITEALSAASVSLPDIWYWARMAGNDGKQLFLKKFSRAAASPFVGDRDARTFWIGLIEERLSSRLEKEECVPVEATAHEAAVVAFFMYLGRIGREQFADDTLDKLPNAPQLFEYIQSQPCVVWSDLRDINMLETYLEVAEEALDWLPLKDEILGFSRGSSERRWALYVTYLAGWHQNFHLLSGTAWDSSSVSEASQFLNGLRSSLLRNCPPEVGRILETSDGASSSWMKGMLGVLSLPTRAWRRGTGDAEAGEGVPISAEGLGAAEEAEEAEEGEEVDEDGVELEAELEQVTMAIERLEGMVAPLERGAAGADDDRADIKEKLEEARALLVDARALHQHLTLIKERRSMGSLDRLVRFWSLLKRSALSRASARPAGGDAGGAEGADAATEGDAAAGRGGEDDAAADGAPAVVSDVIAVEVQDGYAMPWSMLDDPASYACERSDGGPEAGVLSGVRLSYGRLSATMRDSFDNVVLGSRLLGGDVREATALISRKLQGRSLTARQVERIKRMGSDVAVLIPIATVLALPITAVGHTAFLAAIQRYSPWMIPTAFREERLQRLRQLDALKKSQDGGEPAGEGGADPIDDQGSVASA